MTTTGLLRGQIMHDTPKIYINLLRRNIVSMSGCMNARNSSVFTSISTNDSSDDSQGPRSPWPGSKMKNKNAHKKLWPALRIFSVGIPSILHTTFAIFLLFITMSPRNNARPASGPVIKFHLIFPGQGIAKSILWLEKLSLA